MTSSPEKKIRPLVTGTRPVATRAIVDFPAPFGPTSAVTEPAGTDKDTPNSARKRPYAAETSRSSSTGGSTVAGIAVTEYGVTSGGAVTGSGPSPAVM